MPYDVDKLVATARARLASARAAEQEIRDEAAIDKRFLIGKQWDEKVRNERIAGGKAALTINRLGAFRNQVVNDIRQNNPQARVSPRRDGTKETAEVYEGLIRAIQYDSDSQIAFTEAAKYAIGSSYGVFQLVAELVDEETGEHDLKIEPVYDPDTVFFDNHAMKPDRSDSRWAMKLVPMSRIEFMERWPNAEATGQNFASGETEWMDPRGDGAHVLVAEYFCIEEAGSSNVALGADLEGEDAKPARKRKEKGKELVKHIINGVEELEPPTLLPGTRVPLFPVYGDEMWVDGKRNIGSLIRDSRDLNVLYNWESTNEAETLAMNSKNPYLATPAMIQGHEKEWKQMNTTNRNYVLFNPDPLIQGGKPFRDWAEPPIAAISQAKAQTANEMRDVIGLHDPSLGKQQYAGQSGRAIAQLRSEGDLATYHYTDNLSRAIRSMCHCLLEWIPWYYDTEREIVILGEDLAEKIVRVNTEQPHTDEETGKTYHHQLGVGKYSVVVKIGPSYDTEREEEDAFWEATVKAAPELMMVFGDQYFAHKDVAGADIAADRMKRFIAMKTPGLIEDDKGASVPPQVQAQMAQMQQQLQQLQQQLQQAMLVIKTKQIESQGRVQVEQIKQHGTLMKAALETQTAAHSDVLAHKRDMVKMLLSELMDAAEHMGQMDHEHALIDHQAAVAPPPMAPAAGDQGAPQQ